MVPKNAIAKFMDRLNHWGVIDEASVLVENRILALYDGTSAWKKSYKIENLIISDRVDDVTDSKRIIIFWKLWSTVE